VAARGRFPASRSKLAPGAESDRRVPGEYFPVPRAGFGSKLRATPRTRTENRGEGASSVLCSQCRHMALVAPPPTRVQALRAGRSPTSSYIKASEGGGERSERTGALRWLASPCRSRPGGRLGGDSPFRRFDSVLSPVSG
jgi:hypothetical protein